MPDPAPSDAGAVPAARAAAPDAFARAVLDALPLTVWTVDLAGCVTSVNRSWARFAESNGAPALADPRLVHGTSVWEAIGDPAARDQLERAMALLVGGQVPAVCWEFPCSSPDEERVFLIQLAPLRDPGLGDAGAVTGFVFSSVDITPSHQSREALIDTGLALSRTLDLERLFREVAHQARRAVRAAACCLAFASEETATLRVAYQFGYDDSAPDRDAHDRDAHDRNAHDRNAHDAVTALEQRLRPVWRDALANERVTFCTTPRGLELTAPVSSTEGALGAMTVLVPDVDSPQRRDEAARILGTLAAQTAAAVERAWLVRRVEQKRRLEAIGEVAAGVAHELRNPLFGISSAAQLLRFRVPDDPLVDRNVGRILREVERLNRMVTALLDYGRPHTMRLLPGDPDAVWDGVLEGERARLDAKRLTLVRHRAHAGGTWRIDTEHLTQVFLNVLVNAVDAAPAGSALTLASHVLPAGGWRCRLHNAGPAVPPEVLARAFEIFYSAKPGGTGIGLALCQRIIDEHGGTIALECAPEAGTVATITLPPA